MTFTNKAASEMKERVIKALDEISSPQYSATNSEGLLGDLSNETGIEKDKIRLKCRKTLTEILHQFEDFSIMTMDKFNLKLIKAFSRDLDLPVDFDIAFNSEEVLTAVVEEMMSKLGNNDYKELNELILRYAKTKLADGEKWNIRAELINFIKVLEAERNKQGLEQLLLLDFSSEEYKRIDEKLKSLELPFKETWKIIKSELITCEPGALPGGNTTFNTLSKYAEKPFFPLKELFTNSLLKKINREEKKVFPEQLESLLLRVYDYWESAQLEYNTLYEFRRNYFNMALLKYVFEELVLFRKRERIIRINEFNELVASLIQSEDAPFIYERLGNRYKNFLLDEFQDTSFLQWTNLTPLVHNSLANGDLNLIVGDAKQSIYRFKNGVAEQFVKLPELYNPFSDPKTAVRSLFFSQMGEKYELNDNWRSSPIIVEFNNLFFSHLRDRLSETGKAFYNTLQQNAKSSLTGSIEIVSQAKELEDYELIDLLCEKIEECIRNGFKHSDICILGIQNKNCNKWAIELTNRGYQVVSSESLLISNDPIVKLMIAYFELRLSRSGRTAQRQFAASYFKAKPEINFDYTDYLTNSDKQLEFDFQRFLRDHFKTESDLFFPYETLYSITQRFAQIIGEDELSNSYLHHFSDVVFDYELIHGPDISGFLEFYSQHKNEFAVQVPESESALTIMTIHKSKGLEFPVVILPHVKMHMESKKEFLINRDEFVLYKKPGKNEILPEAIAIYEEESDQTMIDNVNLLYVGMTRPKERLILFNYHEKSEFGAFVHSVLQSIEGIVFNDDALQYKTPFAKRENLTEKAKERQVIPRRVNELLWFPDIALKDKDGLDDDNLNEDQLFGNQFHELIALTDSVDDLDSNYDRLLANGKVSLDLRSKLIEEVRNVLANEEYRELQKGADKILREQAILLKDGKTVRPDRILIHEDGATVIDFKTGTKKNKDTAQVRSYLNYLTEMGYKNLKGYLIYTDDCSLISVH